jgi:hypothetical protein
MQETKTKIEEVEMELADLYSMSEEAACFRYNVDYKEEAIDILKDELEDLYKVLAEKEAEAEAEAYRGWADPAFRSVADFDRMRV